MNMKDKAGSLAHYEQHMPLSGRIVVRETGTHESLLLGILHFPAEFLVKETALYLLMVVGESVYVVDCPIDDGIPEQHQGNGVGYNLTDTIWRGTSVAGTLTARFLKAFPESNGWVVYGPSRKQVVPPTQFVEGHAWMDVAHGKLTAIAPPFDARGESVAGILTSHPVWPDANNRVHTLPAMESAWRPVYLRHSLLLASLGAGEISQETFVETVRNDPQLFHIRHLSIDHGYSRYLAKLRELGGISERGVRTVAELERDNALAKQAIAEALLV